VPLTVDRIASPYSIVTRDDGSRQLAYKGRPLYVYARDAGPGERKGDKLKGVWHVVAD
jgi:predicted lipoprotein with Yx(FWY)xxD motif